MSSCLTSLTRVNPCGVATTWPFHPRMVRKTHSFFSVSLTPPLRTSDAITCHFSCIFDPPTPSLGRKMGFSGPGRVTDGTLHPRMVRKTHSFFSVSLPSPLRTSDTLTCHFCCTFDPPTPSLGRKMGFSGPGRVTDGARPFHPRMVRKTHSFFSISLPPPLRTFDAITCHFSSIFDPPTPSLAGKSDSRVQGE